MTTTKHGWQPDLPDHRDFKYVLSATVIPHSTNLQADCPPVYDQGNLGSCTANAIAAALDFERKKQGMPFVNPSRLFIYYNERVMENTVKSDSGAQIRDGIKSVGSQGAPSETLWPYVISKFKTKPPVKAYKSALSDRALQYFRIDNTNLDNLRSCLAEGYPFVFGFTVHESFESDSVAKTGIVPMPAKNEKVLGGHAVLGIGHDDKTGRFLVRNSWGTNWGQTGYFTIPYDYLTNNNLADDFWQIKLT